MFVRTVIEMGVTLRYGGVDMILGPESQQSRSHSSGGQIGDRAVV